VRRFISQFCQAFSKVENLTPTMLLDREGIDQLGRMYKDPRPANVCHLGVKTRIQMKLLSDAFDDSIADFHLAYYLELPQSFSAAVSQGYGTDTSTLSSAFSSK